MHSIETDHLLLGLIREPHGHAGRVLLSLPLTDIRKELEINRTGEKISTSVEIPFSAETKRVLQHARDEADGLQHRHIGPEHLLLGLLREPDSRAAATLARHGLQLAAARQEIQELSRGTASKPIPKSAARVRIDQVIESARQLGESISGNDDAALQAHMLLIELESLKSLLDEQE